MMYTTTFEEPRAWALAWDGAGLAAAQEPRPAMELQPLSWQRVSLPQPGPFSRNGAGVFTEPASWALGWEGAGLWDAHTEHAEAVRATEEI